MLLRIDRNPIFWRRVAQHPEVEPHVLHGAPVELVDQMVLSTGSVPIACEHGGFLFLPRAEANAYDLHTLFVPAGWGREVAKAARKAFGYMFDKADMAVCHTLEQQGYYRSRPPKSHGWVATSDFHSSGIGSLRSWELTRERWCASPVGRTEACPSPQPSPP